MEAADRETVENTQGQITVQERGVGYMVKSLSVSGAKNAGLSCRL